MIVRADARALEPTPEAHFATFPSKLVEPCVLAGTSAKGECVKCGKNWVREMARVSCDMRPTPYDGHRPDGMKLRGTQFIGGSVTPTGWRAQCSCDAPVRPNLVLDPFLGSGTVGKVCEALGRRWVGVPN